jgi:hypothetical protein
VIGVETPPSSCQREMLRWQEHRPLHWVLVSAAGQASEMEGEAMATRDDQRRIGGISVGGIIVIVGILALTGRF